MMLTDKVSIKWLMEQNMTRGGQVGVPVDLNDPSKGLRWTDWDLLSDEDYETIDSYFVSKQY